jgi:hypothetical protein
MDGAPPEEALSVIEHSDPFSRSEALLHLELLFAAATSSASKRRSGVNKQDPGAGARYLGWWREVCAVAFSKRLFGVGARARQCLALLRRRKSAALLCLVFVLAGFLTAQKIKHRMAPLTFLKSCFGFAGGNAHSKPQDSTAEGTSALLDSSTSTGTGANAASSSSRPCIFCNIPPMSDPTSPFKVVLENEDTGVFRDRSPKGVLHLLAVPRVHVKDVKALQGIEGAAMGE